MKKLLSITLCISLLFSALSITVFAEADVTDLYQNDSVWSVTTNGYIDGYYGAESNLEIPEKISETTVTGIAESVFENMTFIESVILPETVTYIGDCAFKNCESLNKIVAPGVTTVKKQAFYRCSNLNYIDMPNLSTISKECFRWCGELNGLTTKNLITIPQYAFASSKITKLTFPKVTTVYNNAFSHCYSLTEISLPSLVDGNLYDNAFSVCKNLEKVIFPSDFVSLGGYTFSHTNISDFSFLNNIQYIYQGDFYYCQNVEKLTLPNVVFADTNAFNYMSSVTEIILPSCTTILQEAFVQNRYLKKVVFSDELESVGQRIFVDCPSLQYIVLNGLTNSYENIFLDSAINRVEFNKIQNVAYLPESINSIIALPGTFESCSEDTQGRYYKVYGTKGSTAETWAKTNGHTFFEISQENSIVTDIPTIYNASCTEPLFFDAIGINSKYQWYGSYDNSISDDDIPIKEATTNSFTPQKGDKYPYYYCKMTSTDIAKDGNSNTVIIESSVCKNELCYIYAKDCAIDYNNKLIYLNNQNTTNILDVLCIQDTTVYQDVPSYVYQDTKVYGTGSLFVVYENNLIAEVYTMVISGDINGDSVINVIDVTELEKVINNHKTLTEANYIAGDINGDKQLTTTDLQQILNISLQS